MQRKNIKLYEMHRLITHRGTGSPNDIARRLHVSRATVFRYKSILRGMGADIVWVHASNSYMYANLFDFHYSSSCYVIEVDGQRMVKAG